MAFCTKCGKPMDEGVAFCMNCGARMEAPAAAPPTSPPAVTLPTLFCTRCGAPLEQGKKFCARCGVAVAERARISPASPAPAPSAVPPSQPPAQAAAAQSEKPVAVPAAAPPTATAPPASARLGTTAIAPKQSDNLLMKIVVGVLGFFALVTVLVIGSCVYIGYRVKKKAEQVQEAYKKNNLGKVLGALGQGEPESAPDLGKILGALGNGLPANTANPETRPEASCPAVDPSQSKSFRDAAASASIPLVPGLTLSLAWTNQSLGGRDVEILNSVEGIDDNTVTINAVRAEKGSASSQRVLCIADLMNARQYETGWGTGIPGTITGTTMFSMSQATFQDLKAAQPVALDYFQARDLGVGRFALNPDAKGRLNRVEPQDVPYSIIVNGERKDLPAIHVKGKLGIHDTEAFVLDDPADPITLSWNMQGGWNFHINYLKITFPVAKEIQKQIASTGCAAVYGIYFDFNSATVRPESGPSLKEIAEAIKNNPDWKLKIEGHTDNVGGDAYNLELSNRRSAAVKQALQAHYQVDPGRVTSQGFGASRPKAPNNTPEGRALNRRVEVCRE